ncbi:MAG: DUF5682 family protein [Myxococcota bacterium]
MPASLHVVGVRHHSPACARLVEARLRSLKPAYVLIEGPVDMNDRLDELLLGHSLPIAIFSYYTSEQRTHASWSPFCAYSPEWVALEVGRQLGADVRFCDLPAWAESFEGVQNRYRDEHDGAGARMIALCDDLGVDGTDEAWDHMFEQPLSPDDLEARLEVYFKQLRADDGAGRDEGREAHMAQCIRWALAQDKGPVVVVCGGWHKPALEAMSNEGDASWPAAVDAGEGRHGSFLVPYSFHRLDSFVGYQSGMPSPAWYQVLWDKGAEAAADAMLERSVRRLRDKKQQVSPADVIAVQLLAEGLQRLRGHSAMARTDLLDGLAGALIKEALEAPLPWSRRGRLVQGTDPRLVEVVAAFSGDTKGALHADTPRPPIIADVRTQLKELDLEPPSDVELQLDQPADLEKSRVLHRLRILNVPGFDRTAGPSWANDATFVERWRIRERFETESALIEAGAYGATLRIAAAAKLEEQLLAARGSLAALTDLIGEATFIGIESLASRILEEVAAAVTQEHSLVVLGEALGKLLSLWRDDTLLGAAGSAHVLRIVEAAFEQGLWLAEGVQGANAPVDAKRLSAFIAMRDTLIVDQTPGQTALDVDEQEAWGVMTRISASRDAPPGMRGAALGVLWSTGYWSSAAEAEGEAREALRRSSHPSVFGDFLAGLFALAREQAIATEGLIASIDETIGGLGDHEFVESLPSLRLGFDYFPPREREALARQILGLHGKSDETVKTLTAKLEVSPALIAQGASLDGRVAALLDDYHLRREEASDG